MIYEKFINPLASPSAGAPALNYGDVNTVTPSLPWRGQRVNRESFKLLILDRATTHFENNLTEKLEKEKWKYSLIPSGLTRYCQPLDISINYPMKEYLHQFDTLYRIKTLNRIKPSEEVINKRSFLYME